MLAMIKTWSAKMPYWGHFW